MGAGIIATSAITPVQVTVPRISDAAIQLQASVLDVFTFPASRQYAANQVEYAALWAAGLAEGGVGLVQSLAAVPQTVITATEQIFSLDPLGALTTVEDAAVAAAAAVLVPVIGSQIKIGQIQLAVQSAMLLAEPEALVELSSGLFVAFDTVARAIITAGQNFVNAVVSLNLQNIVSATVTGVRDVVTSFSAAGTAAVDGIVAAQTTLAAALATRPAPPPVAASARLARAAAADATSETSAANLSVNARHRSTDAAVSVPQRVAAHAVQRSVAAAAITTLSPKKAAAAIRRAVRSGATA